MNEKYKEESIDIYYGYFLSSFEHNSSILKDLSNYDVESYENIINFYKKPSLNNNKIMNVRHMFSGCISLKSLSNL